MSDTSAYGGRLEQFRFLLDAWALAPLLPVLRTESSDQAISHAMTLVEAGVSTIECTATTPGWPAAVGHLAGIRGVIVGLGTVRTAEEAQQAADVGASFLVTPIQAPEVRAAADQLRIPLIEGGLSPTEIAQSASKGIAKLFPAHAVDPKYLASLLTVLKGAVVVPTGGISLGTADDWLAAGATAVGIGSELVRTLEKDPGAVAAWLESRMKV
ncbi:bifunctional 4-hydroxy-2-oxoglutarate aldolase/2-dehydro-3-deoxy-phosphogluconate aldolase [Arthrobacter sp. R1-13]